MSKALFDFESTEAGDAYKLLSGLVVPRPIGWIGTTPRFEVVRPS